VVVTPKSSIPVGVVCSQPAPEWRTWDQQEKALTPQGGPPTQRPPNPAPHPQYPTNPPLARRFLEAFQAPHPDIRMHGITADARDGTAPVVDDAAARFGGVPVSSHMRRHQTRRVGQREQHGADSCATHPGTPHTIRIRGGDEVVVGVSRARVYVCAHHTKRCIVAITDEAEETSRALMASDRSWRTRDLVQGQTRRGRVEVFRQDWKSSEGWRPLTTQPGDEGARQRVILSLLVDHSRLVPPDQQHQLQNNLPAYTVGSLRAHVHVECLVEVIDDLVSSDNPQDQLKRFTTALHEVFALGCSTKHMIQRQWGRLEPTAALKYRAHEVMRNVPVMST